MSDDFYRIFEEKHRGARELILDRLAVYRPFVAPLRDIYERPRAIDLGCGRGEWLEFLLGEGFAPTGVDLDEGMLRACEERGLRASRGDALAALAEMGDDSQTVVSAFHVVEHISFEQLRTLVVEALRVLKPGGLLIMETPNPENIVVATCNFYLDPTHLRPLPPQLLAFLPEYYGFARTKIVRLQQSKDLEQRENPSLQDVLGGVSPDYAMVGQKTAAADVMALFDRAFGGEYGLPLDVLAARYDAAICTDIDRIETAVRDISSGVEETRSIVQQVHMELEDVRAATEEAQSVARQAVEQIDEVRASLARAEQEARSAEEALQQVYRSRSWGLTAPLRWGGWQFKLLREHGFMARAKALAKKIARKAVASIDARPVLRRRVVTILERVGLLSCIKFLYFHKWQMHVDAERMTQGQNNSTGLTPCSQAIYKALQAARERKRRGEH